MSWGRATWTLPNGAGETDSGVDAMQACPGCAAHAPRGLGSCLGACVPQVVVRRRAKRQLRPPHQPRPSPAATHRPDRLLDTALSHAPSASAPSSPPPQPLAHQRPRPLDILTTATLNRPRPIPPSGLTYRRNRSLQRATITHHSLTFRPPRSLFPSPLSSYHVLQAP